MNPITHFLISWNTAAVSADEKRDRIIITVAGLIPDIDGLGAIFDVAMRNSQTQLDLYSKYHHYIAHNITVGLLGMAGALILAKRKLRTALLFLAVFHIHLLCDLVGSRGPDGYPWPIPYFFPFSSEVQLIWQYQWGLVSWQNFAITIVMVVLVFILTYRKSIRRWRFFRRGLTGISFTT